MTNREFFKKVITLTEDTEIIEIAEKELEKLNKKAENNKKKREEKQAEYKPYETKILALLKEKPMLSSELATAIELSTSKTVAILNYMTENGLVIGGMVKVQKVGNRKQWKLR